MCPAQGQWKVKHQSTGEIHLEETHHETTEVLSDASKNKLPLFSHLSPSTQKDKKKEATYTTHADSHKQYAALAEVGSISARF